MSYEQPENPIPLHELAVCQAWYPRVLESIGASQAQGHGIGDAPAGATSRKLMAIVCGTLLLGGGGAFAVANIQAESEPVFSRLSVQSVPSLVSNQNLASLLQDKPLTLYRSDRVRGSDTAESLLERLNISDPVAAAFLRSNTLAHQNLWNRSGRFVTVEANARGELQKLTARWVNDSSDSEFQRLVVQRDDEGVRDSFSVTLEQGELTRGTKLASGVIQSSLFAATDAADLPDPVAVQLAEMFSTDIDFVKDLRKGDRFTVVYEVLEADGELLRSGRVVSAEFINKGKAHQALWFQENENDRGAYYALDGSNLRRAFLASPLEFSRISSSFGSRFHPIKKTWRNHNGTDYAARPGTPIRTVGEGVIQESGWSNSYGNVVYVDHGDGKVTVYAHMQRRDVKTGERVAQGQQIGAVGSTGMSTGPHLHFEFRVDGKFMDPQIIAQESAAAAPVAKEIKERFDALAQATRVKFEMAPLMLQASAE